MSVTIDFIVGIPDKHLPVFKLNQSIVDLIHHGNFSDARFGFGGGYVVLYPAIVLQTVNQCVIDVDDALLKITIVFISLCGQVIL